MAGVGLRCRLGNGSAQASTAPAQINPGSCLSPFPHSGESMHLPMPPVLSFGFLRCGPYQEIQKRLLIQGCKAHHPGPCLLLLPKH